MENELMKELDDLLKASESVDAASLNGEFTPIPDGTYDAIIYSVAFKESKNKNLMFVWEFKILGGAYANRREWKYAVLNSPENMKRLTTDLSKFGIDTSSMEKINNQLDTLLDKKIELTIRSSENKKDPENPYRNISIK